MTLSSYFTFYTTHNLFNSFFVQPFKLFWIALLLDKLFTTEFYKIEKKKFTVTYDFNLVILNNLYFLFIYILSTACLNIIKLIVSCNLF